ncbi:hypothetical protein CJO88_05685 [Ralstonia solanacearum]|nr:hypothetical protein CJO88_05685 [Ralstonia solanacearum]
MALQSAPLSTVYFAVGYHVSAIGRGAADRYLAFGHSNKVATNKNQHFVPRCYLRQFTIDRGNKAINLYNVERDRFIEGAPVKNQCSGDYFYGKAPCLKT